MKTPFRKLGSLSAAIVRDRSLTFAQVEFHAAEAIADKALEALAEFSCHAKLWRKEDAAAMATLKARAHEAEQRRHQMHARLVWEFAESIKADGAGEEAR